MSLAQIKAQGTTNADFSRQGKPSNHIKCVDGFTLSVMAGVGSYCAPRPGFTADANFSGPYITAEVGFPSSRPEPWDKWSGLSENSDDPTGTVYGWVSFSMIEELIALHGGETS